MAFEDKNILQRLYIIAGVLFLFVFAILFKIVNIQFVEGDKYRELAKINTTKISQSHQTVETFMQMMEVFLPHQSPIMTFGLMLLP
jgi:cell division protein FtsI/penicillin-binding protein 2